MSRFKQFILRGNVVDLAVAVVVGAALGGVVQALVKDLITPIIGVFGKGAAEPDGTPERAPVSTSA